MIVAVSDFTTSGNTVRTGGKGEGISLVLTLGEESSALAYILPFVHHVESRLKTAQEAGFSIGDGMIWLPKNIHEDLLAIRQVVFGQR